MTTFLAEMILDLKFHGKTDAFRRKSPFSDDIEATNALLFNPRYHRRRKIAAYRRWLETYQPCVFGRVAAKNQNVFICLLEEQDVLRMKRGDADPRDTIQDYRQVWKRYALEGLISSFLIVLVSRSLVDKEPREGLKQICRRLLELYMEVDIIEDDAILKQREYVFLRCPAKDETTRILKFSTLPNIFCAQGDRRWWHDHRTPGGIMITSNALGHFVQSRNHACGLEEKNKVWALENAMRTINNANRGTGKASRKRLCPATHLIPLGENEETPLRPNFELANYSPDHYEGYFHTDHLVPSVFFRPETDLTNPTVYDDLTFRYIFDPAADRLDHAELMTGVDCNWYDVRTNMDRLPDFINPEKMDTFTPKLRRRLANWLETRLKERLD